MHPIIRLVNRNLTISLNPGFLIWQVIFPLIYIFVAGFAYAPLINNVPFSSKFLDYPAFLASGMIGFNIMNSTLISGIIIWNDRKHGMFEQIMSGPFTRSHYILSNICTIGIIGLVSATLIAVVGYPVFFLFFAFVSTAFYTAEGVPEPLRTAFYLNPLTYLVDVIRAGIFGTVNEFVIMEMIVLVAIASTLFVIASRLLTKLDF